MGSDNFFMAESHVGHDVLLGDHVILANGALLGGHVHVASNTTMMGGTAAMQFVTIGRYSFMGALSGARKDVEPFLCHDICNGPEARPTCVNEVGLKRAGFAADTIKSLRTAYKVLFLKDGAKDVGAARLELEKRAALSPEVEELIAFVEAKRAGKFGRQRSI